MDMKPWSTRIPAAIADGERLLDANLDYVRVYGNGDTFVLTAGEVALAKLGWEMWVEYCESLEHEEPGDAPPPALIAYCKKLEALSND